MGGEQGEKLEPIAEPGASWTARRGVSFTEMHWEASVDVKQGGVTRSNVWF